jgi:hypothetical protein
MTAVFSERLKISLTGASRPWRLVRLASFTVTVETARLPACGGPEDRATADVPALGSLWHPFGHGPAARSTPCRIVGSAAPAAWG